MKTFSVKPFVLAGFAAAALVNVAGGASAAASAQTTVGYEVQAINEISVSGSPSDLVISSADATAGNGNVSVSDSTTTFSFTTNEEDRKITASINSVMPTGLTLGLLATGVSGGTAGSEINLTASGQDLVTGISKTAGTGTLAYTLSTTVATGVVSPGSRTLTLTVMAAS